MRRSQPLGSGCFLVCARYRGRVEELGKVRNLLVTDRKNMDPIRSCRATGRLHLCFRPSQDDDFIALRDEVPRLKERKLLRFVQQGKKLGNGRAPMAVSSKQRALYCRGAPFNIVGKKIQQALDVAGSKSGITVLNYFEIAH